jgi:hypothetical protein
MELMRRRLRSHNLCSSQTSYRPNIFLTNLDADYFETVYSVHFHLIYILVLINQHCAIAPKYSRRFLKYYTTLYVVCARAGLIITYKFKRKNDVNARIKFRQNPLRKILVTKNRNSNLLQMTHVKIASELNDRVTRINKLLGSHEPKFDTVSCRKYIAYVSHLALRPSSSKTPQNLFCLVPAYFR